jgi:hypothetical protein
LEGLQSVANAGVPVAVTKAYDFVLWLLPKVESFPRAHKFTVGERLSANGMDLLSLLVEAAYAGRRKGEFAARTATGTNLTTGTTTWGFE